MLIKVYRKCYDFLGQDEFIIVPRSCPLQKNYCFGGYVWIGDKSPIYDIKDGCKYYDKDSFKVYDNCVECNFYSNVETDKQIVIRNCMDSYSKNGTKVRFVAKDPESYGISKDSAKLLKLNEVYIVDHTDVRAWQTEVYLKEFPGETFNSVWFDKVDNEV